MDLFPLLLDTILPIIIYIFAGCLVKYLKLTDTESAASIHRIVYFICLPSMMFISTYTCDLSQAFDVSLTVFLASAITITFFLLPSLFPCL